MLYNLRRLCSYGLCFVLLVSCLFLTPTKAAVDYPDDGVGFWKMMSGWVGVRAIKAFLDIPESDATDDDWKNAYDEYVNSVTSTVGSSTVFPGGVRVFFPVNDIVIDSQATTSLSFTQVVTTGTVFSVSGAATAAHKYFSFKFDALKVPFNSTVTVGVQYSKSNAYLVSSVPTNTYSHNIGEDFTFPLSSLKYASSASGSIYLSGSAYADFVPVGEIGIDIDSDTRFGSLSNSWAYVGDDGIVTVDNSQLFNETTNIFYNPATNETVPVTDWNYDYSDRSYGITLDDGRVGKIVYGDDSASVNLQDSNGNTITYNYYYTDPSGSGGGSGDGEDGEGNWFTDLLKKLGELLGGVLGGLLEIVGNALLTILDSLITLVSSSVERLANLVNLFGSFGEALSVLWSWLPPDVVTILVAGVTVIVMVAVVKMFL